MRGFVEAMEALHAHGAASLTQAEVRMVGLRRVEDQVMVDLELEMEGPQ